MKNYQKGYIKLFVIGVAVVLVLVVGIVMFSKSKISSPTPNTDQVGTINSDSVSKSSESIQIVDRNIGRFVFERADDGLEGISTKGLIKSKSITYSGALVVGIAQYSSNGNSSGALADFTNKHKELGRTVDFNDETKIYTIKNISNQNLMLAWRSSTYLVFIGVILPPDQLKRYGGDAAPLLNELMNEYIKIYPAK